MIERVLPAVSYETFLIAEATRIANTFHKGVAITESANRWGCPLFISGVDAIEVSLIAKIDDRDKVIRVEFTNDFKGATVEWMTASFDFETKKAKVAATFRDHFIAALRQEWSGRNPFDEAATLKTKSWYRKAPNDHNAEQSRDNALHNRATAAIAFFVAMCTEKNTGLKFEYNRKVLTGTFQGLKRWTRRAPPGGDPSSGYNAVIHSGGLAYQVPLISLKNYAEAA